MRKSCFLTHAILGLMFFGSVHISAQTLEMTMVPDTNSVLEYDYTRLLIADSGQGILSGNSNLQYKHFHNPSLNFVGEISIAHFNNEYDGTTGGISNLFLGVQLRRDHKANRFSSINLGVYLPTASEDSQQALFNNFFDYAKFIYKSVSFSAGYTTFKYNASGLRIGFELGAYVNIPTGDGIRDPEVFGKYGFSLLYEASPKVYLQTELLGTAILSEDGGFNDNSFHSYAFGIGYQWPKISAGLYYRNYFDEFFSDDFDGILGVKLSAKINR